MARLRPVARLKNGLSRGMVPSLFSLTILPSRLSSDCASSARAFSPCETYSFPPGPTCTEPPTWLVARTPLNRKSVRSLPGASLPSRTVTRTSTFCRGRLAVGWCV
jgi:hypothetical protein